ncbi:MAG: hypothetical protein ONB44_13435 [candidate division KSB1 bacterium]|nr:hypothetical protein [candidate division KSB1 bacterium]MDZ7303125.1 hypothetical protein [candidate division KSB1 bacterium]
MTETIISKPLYNILAELTGEERFDVALYLATKDLVQLKLLEAVRQIKTFAERYGMAFEKFEQAWENDQVADKYSYDVEKDYWQWEAAQTDLVRLREIFERLP